MPLYIKNPEAEALARKLARATGESLSEVVRAALAERWRQLRPDPGRLKRRREMDTILRRVHALPVLDSRSEDAVLGYDENGIPR